ncbi:MAG TPA: polysaccharide biosynthesis/export family protein [Lacipirellula sp.]
MLASRQIAEHAEHRYEAPLVARNYRRLLVAMSILVAIFAFVGCHTPHISSPLHPAEPRIVVSEVAKEKYKTVLPPYRIEPPDVLAIEAINAVPKPPYKLQPLDKIFVNVDGVLPDAPISGTFSIGVAGLVDLGPIYGSVSVAEMTAEEAGGAIKQHLKASYNDPVVYVAIAEIIGMQQIAGEHLVGPDGTVTLGEYGSVSVVGKTLEEAKSAIELHLTQFLADPKVAVSVAGYNSSVYYIITQGAGLGDRAVRVPITGNETVLDAICQVQGTTSASSKKMWIARPGRNDCGEDQILPVDWVAITERGRIDTNYQIMPGDRVFIAEDKLVAADTRLGKILAPWERGFGFTLLGTNMFNRIRFPQSGSGF